MESNFWIKVWQEGRTHFHQAQFNTKLLEYFPRLAPQKGQKVLVPLCGKSKDLLWLSQQNLLVHGVELYDDAVKSFFKENQLPAPEITSGEGFTHYTHQNITLSCGDFFALNQNGSYDFVYDRAALVALPADMRKRYAQVVERSLKKGGKCLLFTYEYDASAMDGPPFSVPTLEIQALYQGAFTIELVESQKPTNESGRLSVVESLKQKVYILEKMG